MLFIIEYMEITGRCQWPQVMWFVAVSASVDKIDLYVTNIQHETLRVQLHIITRRAEKSGLGWRMVTVCAAVLEIFPKRIGRDC